MNKMVRTEEIARDGFSVRVLANWILDLAERTDAPVTNMALNKLVYFVVEKVLVEHRRLLTDAKIEAWEHGPVFRELYQQFKTFGDKPISDRAKFYDVASGTLEKSPSMVPPDLRDELEDYIRPLLFWSAARLRALSHVDGGAWQAVWAHDGYANPGMEITPDTILTRASQR